MVGEPSGTWIARYPEKVKADIEKSIRSVRRTADTEIAARVLVVHPKVHPPDRLSKVAKYWLGIRKAFRELETAEAILERASGNLRAQLSALGPITMGTIRGGTAYEVEVDVEYWLVGPVTAPLVL